jgi:hypothetical protein
MGIIRVKDSFKAALDDIAAEGNGRPATIVTSARHQNEVATMTMMREQIRSGKPHALIFGTAWGLPDDFLKQADYILEPIKGPTSYNHLSVRSAAAIILDRLLG